MDQLSGVIQYRLPTLKQKQGNLEQQSYCPRAESYVKDFSRKELYVLEVSSKNVELKNVRTESQVSCVQSSVEVSHRSEQVKKCSLATTEILQRIKIVKDAIDDHISSLGDDLKHAYQQIVNAILKGLNQFEQVQANIKLPKIQYHNFVYQAPIHLKELNAVEKREAHWHNAGLCRGCQGAHSLPWDSPNTTRFPRIGGGYKYITDQLPIIRSKRPMTIPKTPFSTTREPFETPSVQLPKKKSKKATVSVPFVFQSKKRVVTTKDDLALQSDDEKLPAITEGEENNLFSLIRDKKARTATSSELGHEDSDDSGVYSLKAGRNAEREDGVKGLKDKSKRRKSGVELPKLNGVKQEFNEARQSSRLQGQDEEFNDKQFGAGSPIGKTPRAHPLRSLRKSRQSNEMGASNERGTTSLSTAGVILKSFAGRGREFISGEDDNRKCDHKDSVHETSYKRKDSGSRSLQSGTATSSGKSLADNRRATSSALSTDVTKDGFVVASLGGKRSPNVCSSPDKELLSESKLSTEEDALIAVDTLVAMDEQSRTVSELSSSTQDLDDNPDVPEDLDSDYLIVEESESAKEQSSLSERDDPDGSDKLGQMGNNEPQRRRKPRKKKSRRRTLEFHIGPLSKFTKKKSKNDMDDDLDEEETLPEMSMVDFAAKFCIVSLDRLTKYEKAFLSFATDDVQNPNVSTMVQYTRTEEQKAVLDNYDKTLYSLNVYQQKLVELEGKRLDYRETLEKLYPKNEELQDKIATAVERLKRTEEKIDQFRKKRLILSDQKKQLEEELKSTGISDTELENLTKMSDFLVRKFNKLENKNMDVSDLEDSLGQLSVGVNEKEINFIQHILRLPKSGRLSFKTFCVVAALSERIAALDNSIKSILDKLDFLSLERKLDKCMELFSLLSEAKSSSDMPGSCISVDELAVELAAGGITEDQRRSVLEKMNCNESGFIDFLDFTLYVPLFLMIHDQIVSKPL